MLWGGFPHNGRVIMWGRGGSGKSRLAMRWFTQNTNCIYVSLEMAESIALQAARSCGANMKRLFIAERHAFFERAAREERAQIVVIDSISMVEDRRERTELLYDLKRWAERGPRVAVIICHQNKKGQHAGAHSLQHWPDFELQLKAGKTGIITVTVLKSRTCPSGYCRTKLGKDYSDNDTDSENPESVF